MLSHAAWYSQVVAIKGRVDGQEVSSVGRRWPLGEAPAPLVKVTAVTAPFCSRVALRTCSVGFFPEGLAQGHPSANGRLKGLAPRLPGLGSLPEPRDIPREQGFSHLGCLGAACQGSAL